MSGRSIEQLPPGRRVLIARNPTAGARDTAPLVDAFCRALTRRGYSAEQYTDIAQLQDQILAAQEAGDLRCIVAAGGDGTVAMLTNHTPADTPIAILPLGTENLLAKYLQVPIGTTGPARLAAWIADGACVRMDAGLVNGRIFLVMVSCGFDAEVVRRLHKQRTGHIHHYSYARPILEVMRSYRFPELRIRCEYPVAAEAGRAVPIGVGGPASDECSAVDEDERRACWAFAFNLPRYAAGLNFAPGASGTDGLIDVCTFRQGSVLHGLRYLAGVAAGRHQGWPDCRVTRTPRLRIECDEPVPYQCDGDPGGYLPVEIEALPARVMLVVDRQWAQRQGFRREPLEARQ